MVVQVLVPIAVLGLLVLAGALLVRRGADGLDLAPRGLLRVYLYVASLAGIIVLVIGLSGIVMGGFAAAFGAGFVYGESPRPISIAACPPGAVNCPPPPAFEAQQDRRRAEDLIRGVTFTVFGALFWGAHWAARRGLGADSEATGLRRGYFLLGTVIFGLATIILLPTGIYQSLSYVLLPSASGVFRQGGGESLGGGLVTLPVWLIYLWLVVRDVRENRQAIGRPAPAPSA